VAGTAGIETLRMTEDHVSAPVAQRVRATKPEQPKPVSTRAP
jgi:hypothetical protein